MYNQAREWQPEKNIWKSLLHHSKSTEQICCWWVPCSMKESKCCWFQSVCQQLLMDSAKYTPPQCILRSQWICIDLIDHKFGWKKKLEFHEKVEPSHAWCRYNKEGEQSTWCFPVETLTKDTQQFHYPDMPSYWGIMIWAENLRNPNLRNYNLGNQLVKLWGHVSREMEQYSVDFNEIIVL